jgi:hypothetical protein
MNQKIFALALCALLFVLSVSAEAQQAGKFSASVSSMQALNPETHSFSNR